MTKIDSARISDAFVDNNTLRVIHKIEKKTLMNMAYTKATPQVILAMIISTNLASF